MPGCDPGEPLAFQRGASLGRYVVLSGLGSGGMGSVFAAYDPELDRKVAIKVLRGDLLASEARDQAQARLHREARATARLAHPNVVSIFDVGTVGERLFIAMELIEGVTLAQWLKEDKPSWRDILRVFGQAGQGLAAAHAVGLVHRDFKPSNVMIAADGRARVLDFGLARAIDQRNENPTVEGEPPDDGRAGSPAPSLSRPQALTVTGETPGTPAYMAPEQSVGKLTDARADQFSFCVALYQALYDKLPFVGGSREPPDVPADSSVPGWLHRVLLRGLAEDPAARFEAMDALLTALADDPVRRWRRYLLAAVVVVVLTAIGLLVLRQPRDLLCQGAERKLAGIWDPERQAAVRQAFLTPDLSYGASTWSLVEQRLDAYVGAWTATHTEACEATRLRGEFSEEVLDLRMTCLDGRRQELRGLTDLLARADEALVRNAVQALGSLQRLDGCADLQALTALVQPPVDELTVVGVGDARAQLGEARALNRVGRFKEALEIAQATRATARKLSYRPLAGEAELEMGIIQGRLGQRQQLREHFIEAARIAQATRHHELFAKAMTHLILSGYLRGDAEEAHLWGRLAGAAVEGLGGRYEIERSRLMFLGMVSNMEDLPQVAIDYFNAALAITPADRGGTRGSAFNNIGLAYLKLERPDDAAHYLRQALDALESYYPPGHPNLAGPLSNLGELVASQGQQEEAYELYQRALGILTESVGPDHPDLAHVLMRIGLTRIELGLAEDAVEPLERAVELWATHPGNNPSDLAWSRFSLARALWQTGAQARARDQALQARQAFSELGERSRADLQQLESWLREHGAAP